MKQTDVLYAQFLAILSLVLACIFSSISQAASVSDLLISEIMANPSKVSDTTGEWFELYNPTSESIDLSGITLSDDGRNSYTFSAANSLLINPNSYFVLARNNDSMENGGFTADYIYRGFTLKNTRDQIVFSDASGELLRLNYASGFVSAGESMELIDTIMLPENYAASTTAYGLGDLGTPGKAGSYQFAAASPVPLPASVWLMASGLLGLTGFSRSRKI